MESRTMEKVGAVARVTSCPGTDPGKKERMAIWKFCPIRWETNKETQTNKERLSREIGKDDFER